MASAEAEPSEPRWRIGIYPGPLRVRMEEEEEAPESAGYVRGRASTVEPHAAPADTQEIGDPALAALIQERLTILNSIDLPKLSAADKLKLLEQNRLSLNTLRGGRTYKFGTEAVIYSILIFSGVVIVILALLTAYAGLAKEVTITFVGTVVGGTIATIAQKLGKVGS
jgi:hypothetical protein